MFIAIKREKEGGTINSFLAVPLPSPFVKTDTSFQQGVEAHALFDYSVPQKFSLGLQSVQNLAQAFPEGFD